MVEPNKRYRVRWGPIHYTFIGRTPCLFDLVVAFGVRSDIPLVITIGSRRLLAVGLASDAAFLTFGLLVFGCDETETHR